MRYCECDIPSASSHHDKCINSECGLEIESIYKRYSELEEKLKTVEVERDRYKTQYKLSGGVWVDQAIYSTRKLHVLEKIARELLPSHSLPCRGYKVSKECPHCITKKKIDELMDKK